MASRRKRHRSQFTEVWALLDSDGNQVAQAVRRADSQMINIYLHGSDEPLCTSAPVRCWEDAKDYVAEWLRTKYKPPRRVKKS